MRNVITIFLVTLFTSFDGFSQAPVSVQTLTFDSITTRRGTWTFPPASQEYRKILMYYTLKCDAATTQDQYPCGEWDYLTYNNVHVHTGKFDSNLVERSAFEVNGQADSVVNYTATPAMEYHQSWQYFRVFDTIRTETDHTVGQQVQNEEMPLATAEDRVVAQYLWTMSDLVAAGLTKGNIDRVKLNVMQTGSPMKDFKIRMKSSSDQQLDDFISGGFQEVYHQNTQISATGWHSFNLTDSFYWDSTSSIIVECSFLSNPTGMTHLVASDTVPYPAAVSTTGEDRFIRVANGEYIEIPMSGFDFGGDITISFWCKGDDNDLPRNTSIFEARDSLGRRVLNLHHPWNNSRIYWDAGAGSGYDRIDKAAGSAVIKGNWTHWAVTKDQATGIMRIYRNGNVWHSGAGKNRMIGAIDRFILGKSINGNYLYSGDIDEFRVWNTALNTNQIRDWMDKDLDTSHPNYSDLVLYYNFDEELTANDLSGNNFHGSLAYPPSYHLYEVGDIIKRISVDSVRPQIVFTQGDYVSHLDSVLVVDTVSAAPIGISYFAVNGRSFELTNVETYWEEGWYYTYGPDGSKVDSHYVSSNLQQFNSTLSYYEEAYEIIETFEIGRFITPYGIGLDLGPKGFTWVYDVTDYAWLLNGNVDFSAGNQQELIDVRFDFFPGTPPREVIQMDRPWGQRGSKSYRNLDNDVSLPPVDVDIHPQAKTFMMKTRLTGHGHHSDDGNYPHCCEWKDNSHFLYVNGSKVDEWKIWQTNDCAENAVFPQGGTWPGAREGWCPGDVVKDHDVEITPFVSGNKVNLDYGITPVPGGNQGMGSGNYHMAMHFFQYSDAAHQVDAEIYDVISPNKWEYQSRKNPICREAQIILRNSGKETLTNVDIFYSTRNRDYDHGHLAWTGNLAFMEKEVITLPIPSEDFWWDEDSAHTFRVWVKNPNGKMDEYSINDEMEVEFNLPNALPGHDFIFDFRTNNYPELNYYELKDLDGNVLESRYFTADLNANQIYRDSFNLPDGCYTLEFWDTANTGLYYWAWTAQGAGYLSLRDSASNLIESFEREFGRKIFYTFFVGDVPEKTYTGIKQEFTKEAFIEVFPNPTTGKVIIETANLIGSFDLRVSDMSGKVIQHEEVDMDGHFLHEMNLSTLARGTYLISIGNGQFSETKRVVLVE